MKAKWPYLFSFFVTIFFLFLLTTGPGYANYTRGTYVCTPGTGNPEDIELDKTNPRVPNKHGNNTTCWCYDDGECAGSPNVCINNICRAHTSGIGGTCGHTPDCNADLSCDDNICRPKSCGSIGDPNTCNSTANKCFWYAGWYGNNEQPKCVSQDDTRWGEACNDTHAGAGCYSDQSCDHNSGTCYYKNQTPPPKISSTPQESPPSSGSSLKVCKETSECNGNEVCGGENYAKQRLCVLPRSIPNGGACYENTACVSGLCGGIVAIGRHTCIDPRSQGLGEPCSDDLACRQGYCIGYDPRSGTLTCQFKKSMKEGDFCYWDSVCEDGLVCPDVNCVKKTPESTALKKNGDQCEALKPELCEGGACIPNPSLGHHVCATKPLANGSYCDSGHGDACQSKSCTKPSTSSEFVCTAASGPSGNTDPNRNSCELDDNNDSAFKCLSSAETPSGDPSTTYSTPTTNTGLYSCGSKGGSCFRNDSIYSKRSGLGSPNSGGGTTTPGSSTSPAPTSDVCSQSGKGNVDTVFSKPNGYEGPTCDHRLIGATDPKTAQPGRVYADRYRCTKTGADGTNYVDVLVPSADKSCDSYPWIDASVTPVCKAGLGGAVVDCAKVHGPNYTCTFNYNSSNTQNSSTLTTCCPDNKRFCDVAGTCVDAGQGCYRKLGLGDVCYKGGDTDCSDYPAGARCLDPDLNGVFTCQYPAGKPTPTPTPGASNNCTSGFKGTGCPCTTASACGCASSHNPEPSLDDPSKYFCVPFPATNLWCDRTKSLMPKSIDPAICTGSTPYSTPTPVSKGCPNDGNHLCVAANACQVGYGPTNDSVANTACADWNPDTPQCYRRGNTPLSSCSTPSPVVTSAPGTTTTPAPTKGPAATGCPLDNGDGRVNSCQASCFGSYPNARPVGNADCAAAYGTVRGACCTSN